MAPRRTAIAAGERRWPRSSTPEARASAQQRGADLCRGRLFSVGRRRRRGVWAKKNSNTLGMVAKMLLDRQGMGNGVTLLVASINDCVGSCYKFALLVREMQEMRNGTTPTRKNHPRFGFLSGNPDLFIPKPGRSFPPERQQEDLPVVSLAQSFGAFLLWP